MATCAAFALAAAVIGARWQLIAFAAPLLGVLGTISWQPRVPAVAVHAEPDTQRCFEGEPAHVTVWGIEEQGPCAVRLTVPPVEGMELQFGESGSRRGKTVRATAQRWGRYHVAARVDVLARGGLLSGTALVDAAEVIVFPLTPPQPTPIPRTELLDRLGAHLTRHVGPGVEYADIRPYVPGDQLRAVNWAVSARRRQLHVTQRLTDRAADVVVLIDGYRQPAGPATQATERIVRGAAQVVQTALRHGDRAGIVALGGNRPRWLGADIGQRQFYRVLDTVLAAGDGFEHTTGTLAPRAAVPAGAIVIAFSTLLDTEFALAHRSAPARPRRAGGRHPRGFAVRGRTGSAGGSDVGAAALGDVPRHGHRRRGHRVVAGRPRFGTVDGCTARSPPPGPGEAAWIAAEPICRCGWARPDSVCSWWDWPPAAGRNRRPSRSPRP